MVEVEVLKGVLARLGLSLNLSRVIEEVERSYSVYVQLRAEGKNLDSALRRWKDGLEIQRQGSRNKGARWLESLSHHSQWIEAKTGAQWSCND